MTISRPRLQFNAHTCIAACGLAIVLEFKILRENANVRVFDKSYVVRGDMRTTGVCGIVGDISDVLCDYLHVRAVRHTSRVVFLGRSRYDRAMIRAYEIQWQMQIMHARETRVGDCDATRRPSRSPPVAQLPPYSRGSPHITRFFLVRSRCDRAIIRAKQKRYIARCMHANESKVGNCDATPRPSRPPPIAQPLRRRAAARTSEPAGLPVLAQARPAGVPSTLARRL
jgi:hypothetical protein